MRSRPRRRTAAAAALCLASALTVALSSSPAQAACASPTTIPTTGSAPRADQTTVALQNTGTVVAPPDGQVAWSPHAFGADVVTRNASTQADTVSKQLTVLYTANHDVVNPAEGLQAGAQVSSDSGGTFAAAPASVPAIALGEVGQLLDGRFLGAQFIINGGVTVSGDQISFPLVLKLSADKGETWTPLAASTAFGNQDLPIRDVASLRGVRAAGRPIQMTDGTVVLPIYLTMWDGTYDSKQREQVVSFAAALTAAPGFTSDGSVGTASAWRFVMHPIGAPGTDETAVVERPDGALLAVSRKEPAPTVLTYRVSADDGATWSAEAKVSFADQPGCAVNGVYPQLMMMPTGQLVLGSGRPDNWLAVSTDASGTSWTLEQQTYRNRPSSGTWWYGSSGYTALVPTAANRLLQFADNCAAPNGNGANGCAQNTDFDHDRAYRIVDRQVSVLPAGVGKIDLAGKLRHGTVTLTTDLTGVAPVGAVTPPTPYGMSPSTDDATSTGYWSRAEGALDGSTAYWAGALSSRTDGTGTYQLKLDRNYHLTKLGLALRPGAAAGARIATSADGLTWTPATLGYPSGVTAPGETGLIRTPGDRALRYYTLDANARYLRVTTEASSCAAVGGPAACSMINELELYSTVDSFENEAVIPRGLANIACTRLTQPAGNGDPAHDSTNAVRLIDGTSPLFCDGTTTLGQFSYPGPGVTLAPASSRTLQASIYPVTNANGLMFDINGVRATDHTTTSLYHFEINNGGRWAVYTTAGGWTGFGGAPVPLATWTTLRVVATTTGATLYTIGPDDQPTLIGTIPEKDATPVTSITGCTFASGSTPQTGDQAVYDDISLD